MLLLFIHRYQDSLQCGKNSQMWRKTLVNLISNTHQLLAKTMGNYLSTPTIIRKLHIIFFFVQNPSLFFHDFVFLKWFIFVFVSSRHDCGIYAMKCMEWWNPRMHLKDMIRPEYIPNMRKQIANDLLFSEYNSQEEAKMLARSFNPTKHGKYARQQWDVFVSVPTD